MKYHRQHLQSYAAQFSNLQDQQEMPTLAVDSFAGKELVLSTSANHTTLIIQTRQNDDDNESMVAGRPIGMAEGRNSK